MNYLFYDLIKYHKTHGGKFYVISTLHGLLNIWYMFLRVSDGKSFPSPLPSDLEHEYFIKMKAGDKLAREKLIEHNLRLVTHIVKKYYTSYE